jgi:hypothetical protein
MDTKLACMLPYQFDYAKEYLAKKKARKLEKNRAEKQRVKDRKTLADTLHQTAQCSK